MHDGSKENLELLWDMDPDEVFKRLSSLSFRGPGEEVQNSVSIETRDSLSVAIPPENKCDFGVRSRSIGETRGEDCSSRILIVDDLDLNLKLIADMLSLEGHDTDCVRDGAEAVSAVAARHYDLVLMDMVMPGMDGLEATRAIRAMPTPACEVPIVALTANAFKEQLDACLSAGMDSTLTKPMSIDALLATIRQWTRRASRAA